MRLALAGDVSVEFVLLPPGTFRMGTTADEPDAGVDQRPKHAVTLTRGLAYEARCAHRGDRASPDHRAASLGFRVACDS